MVMLVGTQSCGENLGHCYTASLHHSYVSLPAPYRKQAGYHTTNIYLTFFSCGELKRRVPSGLASLLRDITIFPDH